MGEDFIVESRGHCFICLIKTQSPNHSPVMQHPEPKEHVSVHSLSRYLQLDMKKVFTDRELIPRHLVEEVENARLKVELCLSCTGLIGKFSRLSRRMEKVEMEMLSSVALIHQALVEAEKEDKHNEFRHQATEQDVWADKLRILDVIRNDAIQKGSQKLRTSLPRVNTLNMTVAKIIKEKSKLKPKTSPFLKIQPISFPANLVKVEDSFKNDMSDGEHDGDGEINYGQDDWDTQGEDLTNEGGASRPTEDVSATNDRNIELGARLTVDNRQEYCEEVIPSGLPLPSDDIPQSLPDPITGKHKCSLCSKEFANASILKAHYQTVHLKIKYKCTACEKMFTQRRNCWTHYRGIHMGVAFKCVSCGNIFTDKSNLNKHLKICRLSIKSN